MSGISVLSFASSMLGIINLATTIQKGFLLNGKKYPDFVINDLPVLIAFLWDIKNSFLNSKEPLPAAAEASMSSCESYMVRLDKELHKLYGPRLDGKLTVFRRLRISSRQKTLGNEYRSFRQSVLLLKDVCLFFKIQELSNKQVYAIGDNERSMNEVLHLKSMLFETQRVSYDQYGHGDRPDKHHMQKSSHRSQSITRHTHQYQSESGYQDEIDDASLLRLQLDLQLKYPDMTVFTAVICPEVQDDQPLKMVVARVLLDTGSDVNIVSEKYLQGVGLRHLITEIPEDEQIDMGGIEEQGPDWKFTRKFTSRFYLYNSTTTETAEFFVTKSSDWDILISQKQHVKLALERSSVSKKLLWMSKKKRDPAKEAEQREFERSRQELLENQSRLYEEREKMKRSSQLESRHLPAAGRAWTFDDNRRAIMPASISEASGSGQGDLSIQMDSIDDQRLAKLREASIKSGTMQDEPDDESKDIN
ncbi:uncharacterized protein EAF02_009301 [Botrytis sinoallii]|uniref:uncharacterized protein n=1 Tax=Botrytis sinoallii TaxID=1463999 RepID=UPI001901BB70|nr:uncharacterized protein EAF02_009301 [Botrytis sinoallii]KAF7870111.1 hypothetical protein EAF02_009301 [Botrytis sinoallii]